MPGLVRHYYDNEYWPQKFESVHDEEILNWLEDHIYMVLLWPRPSNLDLLKETYINKENVNALANASEQAWNTILRKDLYGFSKAFNKSFGVQTKMFPAMLDKKISEAIEFYKNQALAFKLAGAGGGGYLIMVSEKPIKNAMRIKIRRKTNSL
jgi:galactokinase/mevalonate kinase-like predicted kinase